MSQVESNKPKAKRKDPYKVLGIPRHATEEDIKAAYKTMARLSHPDRHTTGKDEAAQAFIEGHEAYLSLIEEVNYRREKELSKAAAKSKLKEASSLRPDSSAAPSEDAGPSSPQSTPIPVHIPMPQVAKAPSFRSEYPKSASSKFDPRSPTPPPAVSLPSPQPSTTTLPPEGSTTSSRDYPKTAPSRFDPRSPTPPPNAGLSSPGSANTGLDDNMSQSERRPSSREYPKSTSSRFDPRTPTPPPHVDLPVPPPPSDTHSSAPPSSTSDRVSTEYPKTTPSRFDPRSPTPFVPAELHTPSEPRPSVPASSKPDRSSKTSGSRSDTHMHVPSTARSSSSRSSSRETAGKGVPKDGGISAHSPSPPSRPLSEETSKSGSKSQASKDMLSEMKMGTSPPLSRESSGSNFLHAHTAKSARHVPSKTDSVRRSDSKSSSGSSNYHSTTAGSPNGPSVPRDLPTRSRSEDAHSMRSRAPEPRQAASERPPAPVVPDSGAPSCPKSPTASTRSKLRKRQKPEVTDDSEAYVHIVEARDVPTSPNGQGAPTSLPVDEDGNTEPVLFPIKAPQGSPKEWIFPIDVGLEELFEGISLRFRVTRKLLGGKTKDSMIAIELPPGTLPGRKIRCPDCGHQRQDGTFQDVVFIIEEIPHDVFQRVVDDLIMDVYVPYTDRMTGDMGEMSFQGIDGQLIKVTIPYLSDRSTTEGKIKVKGAGMPFRRGRGNLIVRWQVVYPQPTSFFSSGWGSFKKALNMNQ